MSTIFYTIASRIPPGLLGVEASMGCSKCVGLGFILHAKMVPGLSPRLEFHRFGVYFACRNGPGALPGQPEGAPGASGPSPGSPGLLRQGPQEGPRTSPGLPGDRFGELFGSMLGYF